MKDHRAQALIDEEMRNQRIVKKELKITRIREEFEKEKELGDKDPWQILFIGIYCKSKIKTNLAEREKSMKLGISADKRSKLSWIGKRLFWGMAIALLASIALEALIYGLAGKVVEAYTGQFFQ